MFLGHIEQFSSSLNESTRTQPEVASSLQRIAGDTRSRERYLDFARDVDRSDIRARMVKLAGSLGWLDAKGLHEELTGAVADILARKTLTTADVDFVCALNDKRELDAPRGAFGLSATPLADPGHAGALACLGSADDHVRMLAALAGNDLNAVQIAQVYLARRPLRDAAEIRQIATAIGRMPDGEAKVIALETLARHYVSDRESIEAIASGSRRTTSLAVQRAIAGILLRADLAKPIARNCCARSPSIGCARRTAATSSTCSRGGCRARRRPSSPSWISASPRPTDVPPTPARPRSPRRPSATGAGSARVTPRFTAAIGLPAHGRARRADSPSTP